MPAFVLELSPEEATSCVGDSAGEVEGGIVGCVCDAVARVEGAADVERVPDRLLVAVAI